MNPLRIHPCWAVGLCLALSPAGAGSAQAADGPQAAGGPELAIVADIELQPLAAHVKRLVEALESIGQPVLSGDERRKLLAASDAAEPEPAAKTIQELLDRHCLIGVQINPESRVKLARGPAEAALVEQGWRTFLVKVHNQAGVTAPLKVESPNAQAPYRTVGGHDPEVRITPADVRDRWVDLHQVTEQPMTRNLSGLPVEYRILQVFSRDAGMREASISFNVGQGTQDIGFRNEVAILFTAAASTKLKLRVLDDDGRPTTASFIFRDARGNVYPSQAKRLAPDFFFHAQIYRADGETITLPPGTYRVEYTRGPEYLIERKEITLSPDAADPVETFQLHRWIHLKKRGYFSGDHHVHAAGCAHYTDPSRGVTPEDMMRHILGEDPNVGCVLSWGPCWYYQKTFFEGRVHKLSRPDYIMRYDVEVSGFPSDYTGHLCLIGLKEDDYPGTERVEQWPSWDLPILKWGKSQGAVVGFSHSGWGLDTQDKSVPSYEIPPFDGIGANEYIMDVTHGAVDFISAVDTPWPNEMNIWYHTNNAGYRVKLSGETDFPCIYGERVGLGRVYARVDGELTFEKWLASMKAGRSYVSEGHAHLLDFKVDDQPLGEGGSELKLAAPGKVTVALTAAAYLPEQDRPRLRQRPIDQKPYWEIERARIPGSRRVPVEIVVNGQSVARQEIEADGKPRELSFEVPIRHSSWIAARIFASAHTNPVYVLVGGKPIRASRRSIQWCLDSVERCWKSKSGAKGRLRPEEREACAAAYDHARKAYRQLLAECEVKD
ncbi:MAG: hypothetical protein AMXMBFR83_01360 [Phycisphaerae bacterium]